VNISVSTVSHDMPQGAGQPTCRKFDAERRAHRAHCEPPFDGSVHAAAYCVAARKHQQMRTTDASHAQHCRTIAAGLHAIANAAGNCPTDDYVLQLRSRQQGKYGACACVRVRARARARVCVCVCVCV